VEEEQFSEHEYRADKQQQVDPQDGLPSPVVDPLTVVV
jgi:hypothetical protein